MMKNILSALCLGALLAAGVAQAAGRVYFVEPQDGATVKSPFKVRFGVEGMAIAPAGDTKPDTGHHHLIIDGAPVPQGEVVPTDDSHRHFGKGQTETELTLPPGEHTLTLQFANGAHQSFGEAMSSRIKILVKP